MEKKKQQFWDKIVHLTSVVQPSFEASSKFGWTTDFHMDYFIDILTIFLCLEHVSPVAVYAGSDSSWISLEIS